MTEDMMNTIFDNSPFHLVPCSPYIGTTISTKSQAVRAVPDLGENADTMVAESPRSAIGQDVPQTPVIQNANRQLQRQKLKVMSPLDECRVATPEQEVPKTPIQIDSSAGKKTPLLTLKFKSNSKMPLQRRDEAKEINLFHGDDNDIFD
ncbi:uncharacterized protein LOC110980611 [Acanthaster planci]|uniref:Uncharacterized protein LOC110980611 n=1 Tax=Acanthaster planci TaxID=133434 RepID=A0A8B7YIS9_ACAPL|nr:uncharacterized protein LOC110980611 [Acanthaster planci]XP_022093144.1 uncharacterized protein LOC110980611 [Acanthaster planci]